MNRMLAGVSTRKYAGVGEPVGEEVERESSSTAKSTVSELFIERTRTALGELMSRRLDDVRLAVMMLDGMEIADRTHVVALGITTDGREDPARAVGGLTENATARARAAVRPGRPRASIPSRRSCLSPTVERPSAGRSRTCSASARSCIAAIATRSAT